MLRTFFALLLFSASIAGLAQVSSVSPDSIRLILSVAHDATYLVIDDDLENPLMIERFDTVYVKKSFSKLAFVYNDAPTVVRLADWVNQRAKMSDGILSCELKVLRSNNIGRNPTYYLIESGGRNVVFTIEKNEKAQFRDSILLEGSYSFMLPEGDYELSTNNLETRLKKLYKFEIRNSGKMIQMSISSNPSLRSYWSQAIIPGLHRLSNKKPALGIVMMGLFGASLGYTFQKLGEFDEAHSKYQEAKKSYDISSSVSDATFWGERMENYRQKSLTNQKKYKIGLLMVASVSGLNFLDTYLMARKINFYVKPSEQPEAVMVWRF